MIVTWQWNFGIMTCNSLKTWCSTAVIRAKQVLWFLSKRIENQTENILVRLCKSMFFLHLLPTLLFTISFYPSKGYSQICKNADFEVNQWAKAYCQMLCFPCSYSFPKPSWENKSWRQHDGSDPVGLTQHGCFAVLWWYSLPVFALQLTAV